MLIAKKYSLLLGIVIISALNSLINGLISTINSSLDKMGLFVKQMNYLHRVQPKHRKHVFLG